MTNLTIAIDDHLLQAARLKAVQQGTSVNEVCREAIARFAQVGEDDRERRLQLLLDVARGARRRAADEAPAWPGREAFYDEVLRERGLLGPEGEPSA